MWRRPAQGTLAHADYLRLEVVPSSAAVLGDFIARNVEVGSTVVSDAWQGYSGLAAREFTHLALSQSAMKRPGVDPDALPGVHRVISNLKTWLRSTQQGVGADHLDHCLNEFVFRCNRRFYPMAGFATLLGITADIPPTTTDEIKSPIHWPDNEALLARDRQARRCGRP